MFNIFVILFSANIFSAEQILSNQTNLDDCYVSALKRSELIAVQKEQIFQAEQQHRQAIGYMLPSVTGTASYLRQENPGNTTGSSIFPMSQPLVKISATQPLFRGLRDFAALSQTEKQVDAMYESKQQALILLYQDVAANYYSILSLEKDLLNLNTEIELYQKRIKELKDRVKIGRSRISEVLSFESSLASLNSQAELIKGQIASLREYFIFLTDFPKETMLSDGSDLPKLDTLDSYLASMEQRPDVKAARIKLSIASSGISIAKGMHLPSLDLNGNYYFLRSGSLKDVNWDVGLSLSMPIFAGGVIQSKVYEATSIETQAQLTLNRTIRLVEDEIKTLYLSVMTDKAQIDSLSNAKDISEKNYEQQLKEYRLGLVNNIDVLQAMTIYQESTRALDRTRYAMMLDFVKLELATARRPK